MLFLKRKMLFTGSASKQARYITLYFKLHKRMLKFAYNSAHPRGWPPWARLAHACEHWNNGICRCIWSVIRFSCQADAISSSRQLSVSATSTASIASGASNSLYGRLSWHASLLYTSALLPSMLLPVNPASTPCTSTFGFRAYHGWHHSSKLRQRAIYSISSLDKLAEVVQKEGNT